jgi:fibronectin type 3 domain-containing protein
MILVLILASFLTPTVHSVSLKWNAVTKTASGAPLTGQVYYNVYRDISGTQKYSKLNPSPLICTEYYDYTVTGGQSYDYQVTAWTPALGESGFSAKSGNVVIP